VNARLRRFLDALTHTGPSYQPTPLPARGDAVEAWLRARRDEHIDRRGRTPEWYALDAVLDAYRLHADTGTPLGEHLCEGREVGNCDCLEVES
jgi:hypothetical protein